MNRKKLKCSKCDLWFRDREEPEEKELVHKNLCWNCRFVWKCIGLMLNSFPPKINRDISINLDGVSIKKKRKINHD